MLEKDTTAEISYDSIWREPDANEIKLVSASVRSYYEKKRSTIHVCFFVFAFFTVMSLMLILFNGLNSETKMWLAVPALLGFCAVIYLLITIPRATYKLKNSSKGRFLVTDTRVVTKEQNEVRYRGGRNYSYTIKVRVVLSKMGGEADYRTFIVSASDYRKTTVGASGILVRYDMKLDGRPFLSVDHYLSRG